MKRGLTYDDVLLVPKKSSVNSRSQVDSSIDLRGGVSLEIPVFSSSMDTVTGSEMAQAMSDAGGAGIIHRFCSPDKQAEMVSQVNGLVGAAIGISSEDIGPRAAKLVDSGVDFLCIDVAHGHMEKAISATESVSDAYPEISIMAGAAATYMGTKELALAGADIVRVGVGGGSSCLTREKAGVGVPQITAIQESSRYSDVSVVADGGVRKPGDIVKALMAGADAVVVGGLLGACEESLAPTDDGKKVIRGMASQQAQRDFNPEREAYVEGGEYEVPLYGTVSERMKSFEKGIQSGLSYCGENSIEEARENAEFIQVTPNTVHRNGIHGG